MKLIDRNSRLRALFVAMLLLVVSSANQSCRFPKYSFTGTNLSPLIKTFSVYYFPNRAKLVNPTLSQTFTENLKEKLQRQTSLSELQENGDLEFEGQITDYFIQPMTIQKDDLAGQNRLTISVRLKYTNNKDPDLSFDKTFTAFEDYPNEQSLSDVEDALVPEIVNKLLEDIFNATIAIW